MPKRKKAKAVFEEQPPRQMVAPAYAARALEKMAEKVAQQEKKAQKSKDRRGTK